MSDKSDCPQPLLIARRLGDSIAGNIGAEAMEELELCFASRLLPRFSDDPIMRTNQNLLLYWQYGYCKSTLLKVFSQTIPASLRIVDISSMTPEKIFGSIDEKKKHIIEPAFTNDISFVTVSELTSLLGQQDFMRQFVNIFNTVLENEKVSRQTLKLGQGEINELELTELQSKGVFYDARAGEISYTPHVCVIAATRPLDNRYYTYLNRSGHFSRYHVIQRSISDEEASLHLHKEYRLDNEALTKLKEVNSQLSTVKFNRISRPSETLMQPVYDSIEGLVRDEISSRQDAKLADIITPRIKGDIIRELASHAFLRIASSGNCPEIAELQHAQEDVEFILEEPYHFIEFVLEPIIAESYAKITRTTKKDKVNMVILELLNGGVEKHREEIDAALEPLKVSGATVYNVLKSLENEGRVERTGPGAYKKRQGGVKQ